MAALTGPQRDDVQARLLAVGVTGLRPLPGGASSVTLAGELHGRPVVVKVAPPGLAPVRNRDVARQARIIRALGPSAVPVPEVLLEEAGDPPEVPPFFVMSFVGGESVEPLFDGDPAPVDRDAVGERFVAATEVLAALHGLEPASCGLGDEPVVAPAEEVERWARALGTVDPAMAPGWRDVAAALRESAPDPLGPAIVHGDFRLGNLLAAGPRITAVIDWEIWSIGDPRVDVGWFLVNADPDTYRRTTPGSGRTPAPGELAAGYAGARGTPLPRLTWFQGLACFESAATWSLIVKHDRAFQDMAAAVPALLSRARRFLDADARQRV